MERFAASYAHSTSRSDCSDWETLDEHLTRVGARAALYARRFAPELASTAGLLHDLGKAKPRFQAKLLGEQNSESHSGEGALAAAELIKPAGLGKLLAFAIAGHHSGMPNALARDGNGRPSTPLIERLNQAEDFELPTGLNRAGSAGGWFGLVTRPWARLPERRRSWPRLRLAGCSRWAPAGVGC